MSHADPAGMTPGGARDIAALVALLLTAGCGQPTEAPGSDAPVNSGSVESIVPPPPAPLPPLDRAGLLAAASEAADATAASRPLPEGNRALIGRSFQIRLPFGCSGPMTEPLSTWAGWSYDPNAGSLKLSASNQFVDLPAWLPSVTGDQQIDAAEGFWIERPWTSSEACSQGEQPGAADPLRRTLGVVQFFEPDAPRTIQRGARPYTATKKLETPPEGVTYRLALSGRIVGFADRQPVKCWNEADRLPPVCLISVEISRTAFENSNGDILSEWRR
ncbi:hypothetical protein P1X14_10655 [Sphingomonas sp. AOB5]|uniref:hypothetical protein n=1 Tax=Sphingomonas sp. AOB5 TaxID=3034017 RepID=UPI0023F8EBBD|nr:hypothetical protein [Sphingomonas sp. AOB5]MDF7775707.1 hypothetical protein [Sphingomonas sp. AOB5]